MELTYVFQVMQIGAMNAIKIAFNKGGKNLWLGLDSMLVYKNSSIFFMLFYYV
jgi:hypothetical protein